MKLLRLTGMLLSERFNFPLIRNVVSSMTIQISSVSRYIFGRNFIEAASPTFPKSSSDQKKQFSTEYLNQYDIVYISPETGLENINLFLLGEHHFSAQCEELNGAFIRAAGGADCKVFVEGVPSMLKLLSSKREEWKGLGLPDSTEMTGWDASEEIQELLRTGLTPIEDNLIVTRGEIKNALEEIEKFTLQLHELQSYEQIKEVCEAVVLVQEVIEKYKEQLEALYSKEHILAQAFANDMKESPIKITFLERTRAMVTTLERVRGEASKVFFIAGTAHLRSEPGFSGPEYDLDLLHQELCHHKVAILIPRVCKSKTLAQGYLENLKLPPGLVLSEQEITDLSDKLSLLSIDDNKEASNILREFLTPIFLNFYTSSSQ